MGVTRKEERNGETEPHGERGNECEREKERKSEREKSKSFAPH